MEYMSIQYLRGIAAFMVVLYHLRIPLERLGYQGPWPEWLASGVDIFFVISGFIMWVTTYSRPPSPLRFYYKRIVRIVPLYWLLTTVIVVVMLTVPSAVNSTRFELQHVVTSYLFFPSLHPVTGLFEPVLIAGWTLNYEMFFYLIFGIALLLSPTKRLTLTLVVLCAVVAAGVMQSQQNSVLAFYSQPVVLEFALGMCLGAATTAGAAIPAAAALTLATVGLVAIPGLEPLGVHGDRLFVYGIPAIMIVAGAMWLERAGRLPRVPGLKLLGDVSYSVYLSHGIVLSAVGQIWLRAGGANLTFGWLLFCLIGTISAVVAGVAIYRAVEFPLINHLSGKRGKNLPGVLSSVRP